MEKEHKLLTTKEFSDRTGIAADVVSRWIRSGKIKALKQSGRWLIAPSQLKLKIVQQAASDPPVSRQEKTPHSGQMPAQEVDRAKPVSPVFSKPAATSYSVAEFAEMTYLTEQGVLLWLKEGRLRGTKDDVGRWRVLADNLEDPNVKRLLR